MSKKDGYGYEWDAMLIGGPADGCLDRAITINGDVPPNTVIRMIDGRPMRRESLGEKLIEHLTMSQVDGSQRVAVYSFREIGEDDRCVYDYHGTMTMDDYRSNFDQSPNRVDED